MRETYFIYLFSHICEITEDFKMKDKLYDVWVNNDEYESDYPYDCNLTLSQAMEVTYWLVADAYCCSHEIKIKECSE